MWNVDEVPLDRLASALNNIEASGGTVFQIVDGSGSRKDWVVVVWKAHSLPMNDTPDDVPEKKRAAKTR